MPTNTMDLTPLPAPIQHPNRTAPIYEYEFWSIINWIDWGQKSDIDDYYNEVRYHLLVHLSPMEMASLRDHLDQKQTDLRGSANKIREGYEDLWISGDGWSDTINHIVGLGRRQYEHHLENPDAIYERYKDGDYTESLAYCIPSQRDYQYLSSQKYKRWADRQMDQYINVLNDETYADWVKDEARTLVGHLRHPMKAIHDEEARREMEEAAQELDEITNPWGVLNLVRDAERYLLRFIRERD